MLIEHKSFAPDDPELPSSYWILPGGVVERGERLEEAVRREMQEETGLECQVGPLLFIKELLYPFPGREEQGKVHHSVSLGFSCRVSGGEMITGSDPEFAPNEQVIMRVAWIPLAELEGYELYPPFLPAYIHKHASEDPTNATLEFFPSPQ